MEQSWIRCTRLLAATAAGEALPELQAADWAELARLVQVQSLQPLAFYAVQRLSPEQGPPQELAEQWKAITKQAATLDARQRVEAERLLRAAREEGIPVAALKGLSVKELYARPEMRFMSDLDLWVLPEDEQRLSALLLRCGCQVVDSLQTQTYRSAGGLDIELHTALYDVKTNPVWGEYCAQLQRVVLRRPTCELLPQEHYLYLLLHYIGHYRSQGAGLRWLLDLWLFRKREAMDEQALQLVYKELGIAQFAGNLQRLASVLFSDGCSDALTDEMGEYILAAGMFGSRTNAVARTYTRNGGKSGYLRRRIFPGRRELQLRYPALRKLPWLLPVFWVRRWMCALFTRRAHVKNELAAARNTDMSYAAYLEDFHARTGATAVERDASATPDTKRT